MMIRIFMLSVACLMPLLSVAASAVTTTNHPPTAKLPVSTPVQPNNEEKKAETLPTREFLLTQQESDFFIGKDNAKVTIFEYSSLNCPHCASFHHEVFKKIKAEYIDKGLVKYVYRDFPLNRVALAGSKLAHCAGKYRYFDFLASLFESQKVWAFNNSYMDSLLNIAKLGGISEDKFKECQEDKKLEDFLVKRAMDAATVLKIEATPNFFVNGEQVPGEVPYVKFKEILDKKLLAAK